MIREISPHLFNQSKVAVGSESEAAGGARDLPIKLKCRDKSTNFKSLECMRGEEYQTV